MLAIKKSSSANDPSWGFVPFDVFDAGSDLHRAYLTRLCCDFRLSQPLDALIPPAPPRPCFMPNPSLRFCSQRLPPPSRRHGFHRALPLLPLATPKRDPTSGIFAPGRSVRVRSVLPVSCRSILSQLSSPVRDSPRVSALHHCNASSHGLFTMLVLSNIVTALQSVKELKGRRLSSEIRRPHWIHCPVCLR